MCGQFHAMVVNLNVMVERMRILFDALFLRSWPFFLLLLVTLFCFYVCSVSFYTNLESKNLKMCIIFLKKSAQNTNVLSINTCNLSFSKSSLFQNQFVLKWIFFLVWTWIFCLLYPEIQVWSRVSANLYYLYFCSSYYFLWKLQNQIGK